MAKEQKAYTPGRDYDVFVSYAHVDNERGWVTTFVKELEVRLAEALGRPRPKVWMDHQILGNEPLDQISSAIRRTAALLLICSPGYVKSDWCRKELMEFATQHFGGGNRMFVAYLDSPFKYASLPRLGDRPGYTFWIEDPETKITQRLGYPESQEYDTKYYKEIQRLAQQLSNVLKDFASERGATPAQLDKDKIFLAEVPDEALEPSRTRIEEALRQAGFDVLPGDPLLQNDLQQFSTWAKEVLPSCKVFAQVLNEKTGKTRGRPQGLPALQYQLACEAKVPILQWREARLDLTTVQDPEHRQLLEGKYIRTCGIEELVSEILAKARQKPVPAFTPEGKGPWVFVNSDRCDRELALQLREWFKAQRFTAATPIAAAKPREARKYLEDNLRGCDAVLLIYGGCDPSWISGQLVQIAQQDRKRSEKLRAVVLCQLPPPEKHEPDFMPADLITLDGRQGLTPSFWGQIEAFASRLRG